MLLLSGAWIMCSPRVTELTITISSGLSGLSFMHLESTFDRVWFFDCLNTAGVFNYLYAAVSHSLVAELEGQGLSARIIII